MPCCLVLALAIIGPRFVIAMLLLFTNYFSVPYHGILLPILGFFFMPFTTLAYAWSINTSGEVSGLQLVVVILAVLIDLGVIGGGADRRRRGQFPPPSAGSGSGGRVLEADGSVE
jgi:hypothetical protein